MWNLLRKRWWKYASVALLLFALVAGLYTPLSPGITSVSPERQEADGTVSIAIETYNTPATPSPATQIFLSNDSLVFCATSIEATDNGAWQASFDIPAGVVAKTQIFSVVIQDSALGTFRLSSSVTLLPTDAPPLPFTPCVERIDYIETTAFNFPYRVMLYEILNVIRIYGKVAGKPVDRERPFILPKGSSVLNFAEQVHKDFPKNLKSALVWGSSKFDGQAVAREYVLEDEDIVELQL